MLILVEQLRRLTYHLVVTDTEYNLCHENHVYRGCFGTQMITYIASPLTLKYGVAVKRTYQLARLSEKSAKELLN